MKKLKIKVFLVIFSILTTFALIFFTTSQTKTYMERKNRVSDILTKIPRTFERNIDFVPKNPNQESNQIFLDFTIYTIVLDEQGNYQELINHTNSSIDEEYVKSIASDIIKNHKEEFYIGNLYTSKYAYVFTRYNTLVIMDNTELNSNLKNGLI